MTEQKRMRGKIKWWDEERHYGFIEREEGEDIFVHASAIQTKGVTRLEEGDEVEFTPIGERALAADEVEKL